MNHRAAAVFLLIAICAVPQAHARKPVPMPQDVRLSLPAETIAEVASRLVSPMPGAAVTSPFGWRHHPTLKRTRFHGGIDFGAPTGSRVYSAGEGVIETIGRARDRGLYIVVRHGDRLKTGYAHLSGVAAGLKVGQRVASQAWIGKVGRSGRTTGPHLDFEVFVDENRIDPELVLGLQKVPYNGAGRGRLLRLSMSISAPPAIDVHGEDAEDDDAQGTVAGMLGMKPVPFNL